MNRRRRLLPAAGRSRARAELGAHNRLGGDPADIPVPVGRLGRRDALQVHVHAEAGRGDVVLIRPTCRLPVPGRAGEAARDDRCTREAALGDVHVTVDAVSGRRRRRLLPTADRSRARTHVRVYWRRRAWRRRRRRRRRGRRRGRRGRRAITRTPGRTVNRNEGRVALPGATDKQLVGVGQGGCILPRVDRRGKRARGTRCEVHAVRGTRCEVQGREAGGGGRDRGASNKQARARLQVGGRARGRAHREHVAHVRDAGGVEAQQLVERRRGLPSRKAGIMRCGARCGPWDAGGGGRPRRTQSAGEGSTADSGQGTGRSARRTCRPCP